MSDYKDIGSISGPIGISYKTPWIFGKHIITDDRIVMQEPLPGAYPLAWVRTKFAWTLSTFESRTEGRIVAETFEPERVLC